MNITNINHGIAIMKRVRDRGDRLDMACWQCNRRNIIIVEEIFAHECSTIACFAGWIAISPEFQADGGWPLPGSGSPCIIVEDNDSLSISPEVMDSLSLDANTICAGDRVLTTATGNAAIAAWLDIPERDAGIMMATLDLEESERLYGVSLTLTVGPDHVIRVLERLRDTGSIWASAG